MELVGAITSGALVSLDLAEHQAIRARSLVTALTSDRRNRLKSRDDAVLSLTLGTTQADMLSRASFRRADEALARDAARVTDLLTRPGSRMSLAHLPGSAASALAASRGLSGSFSSPHASMRPEDIERMHAELLAATFANAATTTAMDSHGNNNNSLDASALYLPSAARGFGLATKTVADDMERRRRATSAEHAARKRSALIDGFRGVTAGGRESSPPPPPSPRGAVSRLASRNYLLELSETPVSPTRRRIVVSPRQDLDAFDMPVDEARGAAVSRARSPASPRPNTSDSPFVPRVLLPTLPRSSPSVGMTAEVGRTYAGAGDYTTASHAFRERTIAAEHGPARAPTGILSAEPRRAFKAGGLLDEAATARLENERSAQETTRSAHPFLDSKHVRANVHGPFDEKSLTVFSGKAPDGGAFNYLDLETRKASIGRPYTLLPRHCEALRVDGGNQWRAWSTPVQREKDDLRGFSPLPNGTMIASAFTEEHVAEFHAGASYNFSELKVRNGPPQPVRLASPPSLRQSVLLSSSVSAPASSSVWMAARNSITGTTTAPSPIVTAQPIADEGGGLLNETETETVPTLEINTGEEEVDGAADAPRILMKSSSVAENDDDLLKLTPIVQLESSATENNEQLIPTPPTFPLLPALRIDTHLEITEVEASPTTNDSPRLIINTEEETLLNDLNLPTKRSSLSSSAAAAAAAAQTVGLAPSCHRRHGARPSPSKRMHHHHHLLQSPRLPLSPHSPSIQRLQAPGELYRAGSFVRVKSSHTIDIGDFAKTGIDPLLEASRATSASGLPPPLSIISSRWEGPWQGGPVSATSFAHSPMRDGVAHYRRAQQGAEPANASSGGGIYFPLPSSSSSSSSSSALVSPNGGVGTLSPRSSSRLALTIAGRDSYLASPSAHDLFGAVGGARAAVQALGSSSYSLRSSSIINTAPLQSPALVGSLEASVTSREVSRLLSAALHPGASGFLSRSHSRADFSSLQSDAASSLSPHVAATLSPRTLAMPSLFSRSMSASRGSPRV